MTEFNAARGAPPEWGGGVSAASVMSALVQ
jgi:hypothetical protein